MRRRARILAVTAVALLAAATASTGAPRLAAAAGEGDAAQQRRAQAHFEKAESRFSLGLFEDALAEYQAAFAEQPLPALLFNVGQCYRNLERYDEAIASFTRYLELEPDAPNREAVEQLIGELTRQRARVAAAASAPPPRRVELVPRAASARTPSPTHASRPFYRRWWFVTGAVVVVGAAVAGVVLYSADDGGVPASELGNLELPR